MYKVILQLSLMMILSISFSFAQNVQLTENADLGTILTDGEGKTLYYFTKDADLEMSSCNGGCLDKWPIFHATNLSVSAGLSAADFSSFERADGSMQTSYKGWPLYYFFQDTAAGMTNGEAKNDIWFVAKPDYGLMLMDNTLVGADGNTYNSNYELGEEVVQYFTDSEGRTLYTFIKDKKDTNNFTKEDFSNNDIWPVYDLDLGSIPSILDKTLFSTIDVFGHSQITYKGWPLYYFGSDATRGETKGVSVPNPGVWPVAIQDMDVAWTTAVFEFDEIQELEAFPNPFTDKVTVKMDFPTPQYLNISLFNGVGQLVQTLWNGNVNSTSESMQFSNLKTINAGVYFLRITSEQGVKQTILVKK